MPMREDGAALARVASAIADTTRATMLLSLLDRRAWTATELAAVANISRSTATDHLHSLLAAGLITERRQGRHRYIQITDHRAAFLVEQLGSRTPPAAPRSSWDGIDSDQRIRRARTCYDHIAGALGTGICDVFVARGYIDDSSGWALSPEGRRWCAENAVDVSAREHTRRPQVLLCLDWTERRDHLAGALGAAMLDTALTSGWVERQRTSRALTVTARGSESLHALLGID